MMTSQLANKMMMKEDGSSPGTVDQGARGMMMMPQLGMCVCLCVCLSQVNNPLVRSRFCVFTIRPLSQGDSLA